MEGKVLRQKTLFKDYNKIVRFAYNKINSTQTPHG